MNRRLLLLIASLLTAAIAVALVEFLGQSPPPIATKPATRPVAAVPSAYPIATRPVTVPALQTYGQLLHADLPHYPATQPWSTSVDLTYAAHVILPEPIYVCSRGDLWLTRADADPLPAVLARAASETEHISRDPISYIVWTTGHKGESIAMAICPSSAGCDLVSATDRHPLPHQRDYQWDRAMTWDDSGALRVIVPTRAGISILTIAKTLTEDFHPLLPEVPTSAPSPPPIVLFDRRGILAWIPADDNFQGPSHPARYLDGKWLTLDSDNWNKPIIHLIPMLDGSVLQIRRDKADTVQLAIVGLDTPAIDRDEIAKLVDQLSDDDSDKRQAAFDRLTQFGPGIFPLLQQLQTNALPEGQARINQLLHGKLTAKLGGMEIIDQRLSLIARLSDNGVVMLAPAGVSIAQESDEPRIVTPGYLVIRPGRAVQALPAELAARLKPGVKLSSLADEWIITTPDAGPARFLPPDQELILLRKQEQRFTQVIAIDGRGRWLLRQPATQPSATTGPTLLLDPTIPDPSPRLAIWLIDTGSDAGWDPANWPAVRKGKDLWKIGKSGWELIDLKHATLLTQSPPITDPAPATTQSASPATRPETSHGPLLLIDPHANHYYDGKSSLTLSQHDQPPTTWLLPPTCASASEDPAWLVRGNDGLLFLFNDPDRIARIRPTPGESAPFNLEALFTADLPHFNSVQRAWLDPAGRIDVVYNQHNLAIIFPTGQLPPDIAEKILPQDLRTSQSD